MRIVFDKNVPLGVRRFLTPRHQVRTFSDLGWPPRLANGELLKATEAAGFDVCVTCDQNIRYQQNLKERKISLVVIGSNIWPFVREHKVNIVEAVDAAHIGSYTFIQVPLTPLH